MRWRSPARSTSHLVVPLGALVVACLPPFWDLATSGLETGMVFGWLCLSAWLLDSLTATP